MFLLAASAILTMAGTILHNHENYYPAILCIIVSSALLLFKSSIDFKSKKAFVLSLFNILFISVLILETFFDKHIVLAATDWHLGATCILLYTFDIALYQWFFHTETRCNKNLLITIAIFIVSPLLAAAMFYGGVKAWIGLSEMVLFGVISVIAIRNISIVKN